MGSCAAPSAKGDDKFITTDYLQQCQMPDAGRNMIHIGEEGAQKTDTSNLQGNAQTVVITSAFSDKFLVCFIKVKISCQLKLIRFTGESAIAWHCCK